MYGAFLTAVRYFLQKIQNKAYSFFMRIEHNSATTGTGGY
ncbi:hypothetical protein HCH_02376 [Hahella chejuensis KCTC 2396]|uniref:Uncharacterized protein n=1 Tax=Hahella chejuensis (strain KCTC 2396) TaxID=349521 RepID=Q2SJI0_HAHCH|nr:hypothetical protein HCH_02376 [Hahella chejuensis KCTC 2396]